MNKKILLSVLSLVVSVVFIAFATGCNKNPTELSKIEDSFAVSEEQVFSDTTQEISVETTEELSKETQEITDAENSGEQMEQTETADEYITEPYDEDADVPTSAIGHVSVTDITLTVYNVSLPVGHQTMPIVTMLPQNASDKGEIWQSSDTSVATVDYLGNIKGVSEGNCVITVTSTDNSAVSATVNVTVIPDAECTYIDGILIANKTYSLPQSYAPGWDTEASEQLKEMFEAAKEDSIYLFVKSGYRSYIDQKIIYNDYVKRDGKEMADTYSARPGHSEHQTGLAFDLNSLDSSFESTPEAKWIAENSYKYGFIVRYPKGKENITGYIYEPWHVRYLGIEKAKEVYESGLCLEEYLGITSVYSY